MRSCTNAGHRERTIPHCDQKPGYRSASEEGLARDTGRSSASIEPLSGYSCLCAHSFGFGLFLHVARVDRSLALRRGSEDRPECIHNIDRAPNMSPTNRSSPKDRLSPKNRLELSHRLSGRNQNRGSNKDRDDTPKQLWLELKGHSLAGYAYILYGEHGDCWRIWYIVMVIREVFVWSCTIPTLYMTDEYANII